MSNYPTKHSYHTKTEFKKGHKSFSTPEGLKKIGRALKGRKHSEEAKGKMSLARKGMKLSKETRRKLSEAHKGNKRSLSARIKQGLSIKGENHYNWKGGITPENKKIRNSIEFRLWREAVFARDGWTCQKCKKKGGKLHPHHIYNFAQFPDLRFAIDNGITFCDKCHQEFHKIYGFKNNTREQLEEFYNEN